MRSDLYSYGTKFVLEQIALFPELKVLLQNNAIVSFHPVDFLWGYTYHSHCIPPFKPESVLILGYGKGQIASLIRKVHGSDIKVTGVDLVPQKWEYIEYKMKICDAYDFVKKCTDSIFKKRYDYIVIDLCDHNNETPNFVFNVEFAVRLKEMTKKLVCINSFAKDFDKLKPYSDYGFKFHRFVPIFSNTVSFWGV